MGNILNISFGCRALEILAKYLRNNYQSTPHKLAEAVVLLPTRRACLGLETEFEKFAPSFIPRIIALSDLEADPSILGYIPSSVNILSKAKLTALLTKILIPLLPKLNLFDHYKLAEELVSVIDEVETAGIHLDRLVNIELDSVSEYWQITKGILNQAITELMDNLKDQNSKSVFANKRDNLVDLAQYWLLNPFRYDIWLVGTTGTRHGTRELAKAIQAMPGGNIVLTGVVGEVYQDLSNSHPSITTKAFLDYLNISETIDISSSNTHKFLEYAMSARPTGAAPYLPDHVQIVTAETPNDEAELISLVIREALEVPDKTVALITPDQSLMTRVTAQLRTWDIVPDISLGQSFTETAVGRLFNLTAEWLNTPDVITLLSTLKHPLCGSANRQTHLQTTNYYERNYLRSVDRNYSWAQLRSDILQDQKLANWAETIGAVRLPDCEPKSFANWLQAHFKILDTLAVLPTAADTEMLQELKKTLPELSENLPKLSLNEYQRILQQLISGLTIHNVEGIGSRVKYLGVLEARLHNADIVILSGLNEGTWPQQLDTGPWLNRAMRDAIGLPAIDQRLGLAAHDFCSGFAAEKIYLTRSLQKDAAPTIPSRNLRRIQLYDYQERTSIYNDWMLQRKIVELKPISAPMPSPPIDDRPTNFSVTAIEKLMRDPYTIYAKHILKLKPLDPIDKDLSAIDKGNIIHSILDKYVTKLNHITDASTTELLKFAKPFFEPILDNPWVAKFWWPRFARIVEWLVPIMQNSTDVDSVKTEIWLERALNITGIDHNIAAKVDRIDYLINDEYRIIDYKTGIPPSINSVKMGLSPQLLIEAWLLNKAEVINLEYWHLKGGQPGGNIITVKDSDELINDVQENLENLLNYFQRADAVYRACPNPKIAPKFNDYSHLERLQEWSQM